MGKITIDNRTKDLTDKAAVIEVVKQWADLHPNYKVTQDGDVYIVEDAEK